MVRCDCLDPERHGHMDDCPFSEIDALKARLADATRLLRRVDDVGYDENGTLFSDIAAFLKDTGLGGY